MELRTPSVRPSDRVALSPSPSRPSPVPRAGGRPVPASGSVLPVGTTAVMCTATDPAGNSTSASFPVSVTYEWSGLRAPVEDDAVLRAGRTVPVRFTLTGASADVRGLDATLSHARVEDGVRGEVVAAVPVRGHHADGNTFREHPRSPRWTFLWSTKGLAPGDYVLLVDLGDGVERAVRITLD